MKNETNVQEKLSASDRRLLGLLQENAARSQMELAELAGISRTSCWRRVRDFEDAGLISRQVILLDPRKAGFHIRVLLAVALTEHTDENRDSFEAHIKSLPEVIECFSASGDRDYVLQVVAQDMEAYDRFLNQKVLKHAAVQSANSTFVLRQVKYTTALPIEFPRR